MIRRVFMQAGRHVHRFWGRAAPPKALNVMQRACSMLVLAMAALAVRAATAQTYGPSPGERGDPYSPLGPQAQVQARYPLPQTQPPTTPTASPMPQAPMAQPQQQAGYVSVEGTPAPSADRPGPDQFFQPNQIMATVGSEFILAGEISGAVEQILAPLLPQVKSDAERQELARVREGLTRQVLGQAINTKLMYLEFLRQVERNAGRDKLLEVQKTIESKMLGSFEKELTAMREQIANAQSSQIQKLVQRDPIVPRLAVLMRDNQLETLNELDAILRQYGSSLDKQLRFYGEDRLGRETVRKQIFTNEEVSHQEMLDYYAQNAADFAVTAKARFEILTVKFANFAPTDDGKRQAFNLLAQMGNEVYFGAPFATIARKHSQEPNAEKGGFYDWTSQGSLASKPIDQAIFTLEPNKLSQIIEDDRGYHIVRVLERTEAGQVPFLEAQVKIKEAIIAQRREADTKRVLDELRTKTHIWTIYDEAPELARQPGAVQR
jgi:parvulin-like peptidyl-prolyl isomerase